MADNATKPNALLKAANLVKLLHNQATQAAKKDQGLLKMLSTG